MIEVSCKICGKTKRVSPSRIDGRDHFCGRGCMLVNLANLARLRVGEKHQNWRTRESVPCTVCGIPTLRKVNRKLTSACCSDACRIEFSRRLMSGSASDHPAWRGGHSMYRGIEWSRVRVAALERDGFKCVRCGVPAHDVHHLVPFKIFANPDDANVLSNAISLCKSCHSREEALFWSGGSVPMSAKYSAGLCCKKCGKRFDPISPIGGALRYCPECRVFVSCLQCGKSIDVTSRQKKPDEVKFCSKRCQGLFHGPKNFKK